ncbi:MAG: 16S rRNA (cytosine(1402)-N(4))-methyltransferase RsmH, partial [Candidatus Omnitrophota bacterium]
LNHYPVMHAEVLTHLALKGKKIIVDCTVGIGSHAGKLLAAMDSDSVLIGVDRDTGSLEMARARLKPYEGRFILCHGDFAHIDSIVRNAGFEAVDGVLFDLGISSYQLSDPQRGFSFMKEGPLDMRMDKDTFLWAYDLVNNLSENELGNIFRKFGEERYYRKIAHCIIQERKNEPIATTTQLAEVVSRCISSRSHYTRIHPATRVFQSLRIAVNRELDALSQGLAGALSLVRTGGRIAVISFHSLEDRIAKHTFRHWASEGLVEIVTKKPLVPSEEEKEENWPSRSAKLRVAVKK